jgi:hypothetical protein
MLPPFIKQTTFQTSLTAQALCDGARTSTFRNHTANSRIRDTSKSSLDWLGCRGNPE